jgi:coenzyme F420-reducing hydrogenase delta subunit
MKALAPELESCVVVAADNVCECHYSHGGRQGWDRPYNVRRIRSKVSRHTIPANR